MTTYLPLFWCQKAKNKEARKTLGNLAKLKSPVYNEEHAKGEKVNPAEFQCPHWRQVRVSPDGLKGLSHLCSWISTPLSLTSWQNIPQIKALKRYFLRYLWSNPLCRSATQGFCNQEAVRKWGWPRWIKCFQGSSRRGLNRQHNSFPQQLTSCPKLHCFQHAGDEWDVSYVCKRCRVSQWVCFSWARLEKAGPRELPFLAMCQRQT